MLWKSKNDIFQWCRAWDVSGDWSVLGFGKFCSCLVWCEQLWVWQGWDSCLISLNSAFGGDPCPAHSHLLQPQQCRGLSLPPAAGTHSKGWGTFPWGIPGGEAQEHPSPGAPSLLQRHQKLGMALPGNAAPIFLLKIGNGCPSQYYSHFIAKKWEWLSQAVLLPFYC